METLLPAVWKMPLPPTVEEQWVVSGGTPPLLTVEAWWVVSGGTLPLLTVEAWWVVSAEMPLPAAW